MADVLDDLKVYYIGLGLITEANTGTSTAWEVPAGNGPYTLLIETGGMGAMYIHNQKRGAITYPSVQVTVKASSYVTARNKAEQLFVAAEDVRNQVINGSFHLRWTPLQSIFDGGLDSVGKAQAKFNLSIMRRG